MGELTGYLAAGGSVVGTAPVGEVETEGRKRFYNELVLKRALSPWGRVRVHRFYRSPVRNLLPLKQESLAVFIFQVTPPNLPDAR